MTIQQAKEIDMVDYLSTLGYQPTKVNGKSYWYLSPLHDEKTASFKINRNLNRWYDFAEGKGGNLVDFGILLNNCSVSNFLEKLEDSSPGLFSQQKLSVSPVAETTENNRIQVLSVHEISSYPLQKYLQARKISSSIADQYLKEVRYQISGKTYYALGFKNDSGGYELRNENFKGSCSPKDITFIDKGSKELVVFEGFFNFLSYQNLLQQQPVFPRNFLILNSTSFFEKSLPKMQEHQLVHLFLDNDHTGQKYTERALNLDAEKFKDQRKLYQNYDDLNDWLVNMGKSQKQHFRQRP